MIIVKCEGCGAGLKLADDKAGKHGKCPKCGEPFVAPSAPAASAASAAESRSVVGPGSDRVASFASPARPHRVVHTPTPIPYETDAPNDMSRIVWWVCGFAALFVAGLLVYAFVLRGPKDRDTAAVSKETLGERVPRQVGNDPVANVRTPADDKKPAGGLEISPNRDSLKDSRPASPRDTNGKVVVERAAADKVAAEKASVSVASILPYDAKVDDTKSPYKSKDIHSLCVSDAGNVVSVLLENGKVVRWEANAGGGRLAWTCRIEQTVPNARSLTMGGDGKIMAVAAGRSALYWRPGEAIVSRDFGHDVWSISLDRTGTSLVARLANQTWWVWNLRNGEAKEYKGGFSGQVFLQDDTIAGAIDGSNLVCYDVVTGQIKKKRKLGERLALSSHLLAGKASWVLTGYNDGADKISMEESQAKARLATRAPGTTVVTIKKKDGTEMVCPAMPGSYDIVGFWAADSTENHDFIGPKDLILVSLAGQKDVILRLPPTSIPIDAGLLPDANAVVVLEGNVDLTSPSMADFRDAFTTLDQPRLAVYSAASGEATHRGEILDESRPMVGTRLRMKVSGNGRYVVLYRPFRIEIRELSSLFALPRL